MTDLIPLKFGVANNSGAPNVRYGIAKGFFKEEGLDLSIHRVFGGPELARDMGAGIVEIGEFGSPPALTALGNGAKFKIIAGGTRQKFMLKLGVRADITDWPGLKGARVGLLSRGSCDEWIAKEMWRKNGLDPETDLEFVIMGDKHPKMREWMRDGKIEAMLGGEPSLTAGEAEGYLRVWAAGWDYIPTYQWGVMVANPDFIEQQPELVRKVVNGAVRAIRHARDNIDQWAEFFADYYNIPTDISLRSIERDFPMYETDGQLDLKGLENAIALQYDLGAISRKFEVSEVVDTRFIPDRLAA